MIRLGVAGRVCGGSLLLSGGCTPGEAEFTEYGRYPSADNSHTVVLTAAPGALAYAPTHLKFWVLRAGSSERELITMAKISNDGVPVDDSNVRAKWISVNKLRFCLSGDEQADEIVIINLEAGSAEKQAASCID